MFSVFLQVIQSFIGLPLIHSSAGIIVFSNTIAVDMPHLWVTLLGHQSSESSSTHFYLWLTFFSIFLKVIQTSFFFLSLASSGISISLFSPLIFILYVRPIHDHNMTSNRQLLYILYCHLLNYHRLCKMSNRLNILKIQFEMYKFVTLHYISVFSFINVRSKY